MLASRIRTDVGVIKSFTGRITSLLFTASHSAALFFLCKIWSFTGFDLESFWKLSRFKDWWIFFCLFCVCGRIYRLKHFLCSLAASDVSSCLMLNHLNNKKYCYLMISNWDLDVWRTCWYCVWFKVFHGLPESVNSSAFWSLTLLQLLCPVSLASPLRDCQPPESTVKFHG